ncbi:REP-associated tyrosine transposase [Pseudoxanthomonas putridarboris]|uniref:Transposase n=1 Tax=Pseudoxanthomonas putridarboris TaxID=752605 RepID=A0ABU9J2A2_9GAMM
MATDSRMKSPGHAALRTGRVSLTGQVYLVTFTTKDRACLFADHEAACIMARAITDARLWYRSRLLAWVLMPDHWHGLVELGPMDSLSVCVQKLKSNTARVLRSKMPGFPDVWAPSFHDRALRSDENLLAAARYVIANPLRAGLTQSVRCYPYWNAVWL